jgi:hypothetical protein
MYIFFARAARRKSPSISRDLVDKGANIAVSQHLVEALDDQADLSKMETYDGIGKVDVS